MITVTPDYLAEQGLSPTIVERFWKKVFFLTYDKGCWLWIGAYCSGGRYGQLCARYEIARNRTWDIRAHVLSWILHYGPIPDGLEVCHSCDTGLCVRPDHLWLGTHDQNMADCKIKGMARTRHGESHGNSRLTETSVTEIRRLYASGVSADALAVQFHVARSTAFRIVARKAWAHIN